MDMLKSTFSIGQQQQQQQLSTTLLDIQVTDCLESNASYKFERALLIGGNPDPCFVLTKYSGTSTIGAIDIAAATATASAASGQVSGASNTAPSPEANATPMSLARGKSGETPVQILDVPQSEYLLVLAGDKLRIYSKNACFKTLFDSGSSSFARKAEFDAVGIRFIVANNSYIVGIGIKALLYWKLPVTPVGTPLEEAFKVLRMTDFQDESGQIGNISEFSSFIGTDKLVIINNNPSTCLFQVWDLANEKLEGWAKHPTKAEGMVAESFLTFKMSAKNSTVVGTCRSSLYIWDIAQPPSTETLLLYDLPAAVVFENTIITALYADADFIVVGDNYGTLTLLSGTGQEIYRLNTQVSQAPKSMDINSLPFSQLSAIFKEKVNDILRVERWVLASFASGHIGLYDIFAPELPAPIDDLSVASTLISGSSTTSTTTNAAGGSGGGGAPLTGFGFAVAGQKVYCLAHPPGRDPKTGCLRLPLEAWSPSVSYGSFADCALRRSTWLESSVPILAALLRKISNLSVLHAPEHAGILEDVRAAELFLREHRADIERAIPFLLVHRMVRAHDMFESAALTLEKGSTKEKHKDAFRTNAAEFFRAVKTVRDVLEFYAPKAPALPPSVIAPIASASSATAAFTPITVVRSRVPTTATAAATTPSASSATLTPSSPPPQPVSSSPASSAASASTPRRHHQQTDDGPKEKGLDTETSREERIGEMLADLDTTLMGLYSKMDDAIESFDNACNAEPPSNDTKALALLSVYTRMYQLNEDLKETGKDVAVIRGAPTSSTWHGQGGNYSVPIEIKSTK